MRRAAPIVLLALLGLTLLFPTPSGAAGSALKIGAIYPLSGNQGEEGAAELAGVQLAADLVNADRVIPGRHIELIAHDAPSADAAPGAADELLARGLKVFIGSYGSTISLPASLRVSQAGGTYLETGAVANPVTERGLPGILRTVATGSTLGRNAARFAHGFILPQLGLSVGSERTVILYEGDQYGTSVGRGAETEARALGLKVVDTVVYDAGHADFAALAARVDDDHPDLILTASYIEDGLAFRRAALDRHLSVKAIVGTSSAYCMQDFGNQLGADATGLFASDKPNALINANGLRPEARALLARASAQFRTQHGHDMEAASVAGFVGGWVLFHEILPRVAAAHGDLSSRDQLMHAAGVLDLPYGSQVNGAGVQFAASGEPDAGQNRRAVSVIWEWVGLRKRAVVFPPEYATDVPRVIPITN